MSFRAAAVFACLFFSASLVAPTSVASAENGRSTYRFPYGETRLAPAWMMKRPEGYEFSPTVSAHDPLHQHPPAWAGQWEEPDWSPETWPEGRTVESVLDGFSRAGLIAPPQPGRSGLTLGPRFYTLSRRDQDRVLKLAVDHAGYLDSAAAILLRDHKTGRVVGSYGPAGARMF